MATNMSAIIAQLPLNLQGQVPRYEETVRPNMYAAIGISLLVVYVCVGLRIYGRRLQGQSLWWDDYTSIIALSFTSLSSAVLLYLIDLGYGRHEIVLVLEDSEQIGTYLRMVLTNDALYFPSICFSKLSILFQYRRLFPSKRFRLVLVAVGVASTLYCIISMSVLTALCLPIKVPTLEDPLAQPVACTNIAYMVVWVCSINSAFDLIILILPMHNVWDLKATIRRKIQLTALFLVGSFVVAISILRTWYFSQINFDDFTWSASLGNMWTEVVGCMEIVVGCLPAMMPILRGRGFGRKKPTHQPAQRVNLVTFGSGGKMKKPNDTAVTMQTTITSTTHGEGNYTELINQVGQEYQAKYYQSDRRW